ncbi:MAG: 50S ribosomal protein L23 [Candidatus Magasanikbacteria bacterium RIFCSPLOWO2_12_FULL_47_9b]|nr:MAG: 50S ribosomal protein L23 [Candidatus Magasanikbacteria bacterium RIFCSPLOWO2_02_FULL_47_16]OGH79423.1 MAG: 50S ribosomal protein L23 [Candidatus Magasanikbacteria bacterium RIFCSPHIGHO2_02_FULL_48_18]OGH81900.1 MAG: 50S ribosomal protein L23 [Candidatus Magasanikbacteria bacterium RIFCSPLOWO2_12_FULL_47_9b]
MVLHPIISEKATLAESQGIYTFAVSNSATKIDVKFAIKQQYGILPKRVSMLCMEGKRLRFGRNRGKRSDWKKAVVSLPKGKTIHIHEGV